jgi:hypothetical protein
MSDIQCSLGSYIAIYMVQLHGNKLATGEWVYPIFADINRKAGAVGHVILVIVLCALIYSLGLVGVSIVNRNGALPPVDVEGWVGRVVHKEAVAAVASVLTLKLLATHKLYVQVDTHPIE